MTPVKFSDHPDIVGGIKWSELELKFISDRDDAWKELLNGERVENAELKEQVAQLKTVPMKYRRMEFNAQLQEENAKLKEQVAQLEEIIMKEAEDSSVVITELIDLQSKSAALVDALESAQRLIRDNHDAIRNNLQAGFERIQATEIMTEIRAALAAFKGEK